MLMMASDSSVTINSMRVPKSPKMWRHADYIVGCAGSLAYAEFFVEWLRTREGQRPKGDYCALMLYRDGRISWWHPNHKEKFIDDDFFAIGSGDDVAIGAMECMHHMGLPIDPRIAVQCAARRDTNTSEPIRVLRWKDASAKKGK